MVQWYRSERGSFRRSADDPVLAVRGSLDLLGGFRLCVGTRPVDVPGTVQRLLALLGVLGDQPRTTVAGSLWPDVPEHQARASLRTALWRLHRRLPVLVGYDDDRLALSAGIDVDTQLLADGARRIGAGVIPSDEQHAVLRRRGELLPGWYEDWVVLERERCRQLRLHALETLAASLAGSGRIADAIDVACEVIGIEPLRESAHRVLIELHLAEDNVEEALRQFGALRRLLAREIGVEPSTDLHELLALRSFSRRSS